MIRRILFAAALAVLVSFGTLAPARTTAPGRFDNIHTTQCDLGCRLCHCILDEDS